jgi:hypothetical protein
MRKFRLNKLFNAIQFLYFTVLACTYQNRSNNFFKFYMPWNNLITKDLGFMLKP